MTALLREAEEPLMRRVMGHAERLGFARYASCRQEDWRVAVRGLTDAVAEAMEKGVREYGAEENPAEDPLVAFGVLEAQRHRERGVSLSMFQGLYKYFRKSFQEELRERAPEHRDWRDDLALVFDRIELAFCAAWTSKRESERIRELQLRNRGLMDEKSLLLTLLESLVEPIAILSEEDGLEYSNAAFRELSNALEGGDGESVGVSLGGVDWFRRALREQRADGGVVKRFEKPLGADGRHYDATLAPIADASGVRSGTAVMLLEVTEERKARLAFEHAHIEHLRMLEGMPVAVVLTRVEDSVIIFANELAAELIGVSVEQLVGSHAPDFYENPEDRKRIVEALRREGRVHGVEVRLKGGEGGRDFLLSSVETTYFEDPCYLFSLIDITERRRIESEVHKLSQALTESPIAVLVTDHNGDIEYVNNAFIRLTGYGLQEVLGKKPGLLKSGQQKEDLYERLWATLLQGRTWRGELCNLDKQGREFWVMAHISPLQDAANQTTHYVSFMEDISKRKVAESVLQERLQFIQTLMDAVPTPIFYKNVDGVYQGCNRAFEQFFGIVRPLLIGKTVYDIAPGEMARTYHDKDVQLARQGGIQIYESNALRKDGEVRDVIFHKAAYTDSKGNPAGIVGSVTDITERKLAERGARENEATLRHVLAGIRAGIIVVDLEKRIIRELNERAEEMLGADRRDYVDQPCDALKWLDEFGRAADSDRILVLQNDKEYRLVRSGRPVLPVSLTVLESSVRGARRMLLILFDLSERKALERQLNLAQKLESVGQLAAGIAHEINTPMQYVGSNLTYLADVFQRLRKELGRIGLDLPDDLREELEEEIVDAIRDAQDGTQRVASIVQAMRKFSHPGEEDQIPVDINEAIRNTVTIARNEWKYHSEVHLDLDESLPRVVCVPGDFNQVVLNVLVNAAHAVSDKIGDSGDKGDIRITTQLQGRFAEIRISDTGNGIPEEHRDRIFDPFFTTKVVGRGTGQGLAITHAIVDRHEGEIDFITESGEGTTFVIRFPVDGSRKEEDK